MHFTHLFAERILKLDPLYDVDVLKIDVPANASIDTPWRITRLERRPYYIPVPPTRRTLGDEGRMGYKTAPHNPTDGDTDVAALLSGAISVTPLSLDMTSRVDPKELHRIFERGA
jgi:5'-nucleotidase